MNAPSHFRVFARREAFFGDEIAVTIGKRAERGWAVMVPEQWEVHDDAGAEIRPTMRINRDCAQAIVDELWALGIRPTEGTGSAGSLAATERHLADMRVLVAKGFNAELK